MKSLLSIKKLLRSKAALLVAGCVAVPMFVGAEQEARLEITGKEKTRFLGFCISEDGKHEKKLEGMTPAEFQIDMKLHRCEVKPEDTKASLGVRLFHQRQVVFEKTKPEEAVSGIEFVIPLGRKPAKK